MDYAKYMKGVSGVNTAKLALWAALLFMVHRRRHGGPGLRTVLRDHAGLRLGRRRFLQALADAFEEERPGDGGVAQDLGETAAVLRRDEFAPGDPFLEGAAAQAAPMGRLRADPHPVVKPHFRQIQVQAGCSNSR